jgi:tetratricopeptide (TPR) repeat protein
MRTWANNVSWIVFLAGFPVLGVYAQQPTVPYCGSANAGPVAPLGDGKNRPCMSNGERHYVPRHRGLGFEILDSESQACFVPDQAYRLLDNLIDSVLSRVKYDRNAASPAEQARSISEAISSTLREMGFAIFIDTETLSDALVDRNGTGEPPRRIFDCDTGSLIFLTIAENLGAPVAMVEMPLPGSKFHHNFVRWLQGNATLLEWDMNLQSECTVPPGLSGFEGKSMSRDEEVGYALSLRANLWERQADYDHAITDLHTSMILYTGSDIYNNLAWLISTRQLSNRNLLSEEALIAAQHAETLWPTANYKDTLACVYAMRNEYAAAISKEKEALQESPYDASYLRHLKFFQGNPTRNCMGE